MANFVKVTFAGDASSLKDAVGGAEDSMSRMGKASARLKTALKVGAVAGFAALGAAVKIGFGEFMESQKVAAQTNAVLKSTGGAAKVTAGHVSDLAGALLRKSGVDDEVIQSGANVLLTFTKIRNEVGKGNDIFDQATATALDMSVALGQDMQSSVVQLGKALNDPIKGITALSRVGVSFTESQKDQIEAMVAAGDTMGAQKLILQELQKEFGGSAEAAGKTLPGQLNILKETFNNLAGQGVGIAITKLLELVAFVREKWPQIKEAIVPTLISIRDTFLEVWERFGPVVETNLRNVLKVLEPALKLIRDAVELVLALIRGDWAEVWDNLKGVVTNTLALAVAAIKATIGNFKAAVTAIGTALLDAIRSALSGVFSALVKPFEDAYNRISSIIRSITTLGGLIGDSRGGSTTTIRDATRASRHAGGVVPGPRGKPTPILALGGERILSPGNSGAAGAPSMVFHIQALDPRAAATAVREALQESVRINGPIPGVAT